jgi:hypothetical protein
VLVHDWYYKGDWVCFVQHAKTGMASIAEAAACSPPATVRDLALYRDGRDLLRDIPRTHPSTLFLNWI